MRVYCMLVYPNPSNKRFTAPNYRRVIQFHVASRPLYVLTLLKVF